MTGSANRPRSVKWSVLGLLGLTLVKGVLNYFQGLWTEIASQNVAFDLRNAIQTKLTLLSFSFHDQSETGRAALARRPGCGAHPLPDRAGHAAHPGRRR